MKWSEWGDEVPAAIKAMEIVGLDFGAVDVIKKGDTPYVLEINSAPWTSPYQQEVFAEAFCYMITNPDPLGAIPDKGGTWKDWIHPSRWASS